MKHKIQIILILSILPGFLCCNESPGKYINLAMQKQFVDNKFDDSIKKSEYTIFAIDTIPDITEKEVTSADFIKKRLDKLIGNSMKKKCEELGVSYPPKFVLFRSFKLEKEFEIWVGDKRTDSLKLLALLPVCAVDFVPGPKLEMGDGKTPEGFYNCSLLYGSSYSFMWINLNTSKIKDFGKINNGCSSFKICTDYPLQIDINRTKKNLGVNKKPGSEICIHGNCVTAGCISFENVNFLPVFLSAANHKKDSYGNIKIHIYPFRFSEENKVKYSKNPYSEMKEQELLSFWNELEKGYKLFESNHKALKISFVGDKYEFQSY